MPRYVNSFAYDAAGRLTAVTYADQTIAVFSYDPKRPWLKSTTVTGGGNPLYQAAYQYFPNSLIHETSSTTNAMNLVFTYDDLNRLTSVSGDLAQTFQYDAIGNMIYNSAVGNYTYRSSAAGRGCGSVGATASPCPHAVKSTVSSQNLSRVEVRHEWKFDLRHAQRCQRTEGASD